MPDNVIATPVAVPSIDRLALGVVDVRGVEPAGGFTTDCYCLAEE